MKFLNYFFLFIFFISNFLFSQEKPTNDIKLSSLPYFSSGKGIGITSPDSLYQLNIRFRMQNRVTYVENDGESGGYDAQIRRLRLRFDGFVGNPKFLYAIQLSFAPAIAALAAGNTVILKPSELAANSAQCMAELVEQYFNPQLFTVVLGGVAETTALLQERFDKIFFTGSPAVGRIVYQAAAKHLTPVTLELGGKSPAILTPSTDLPTAIKRLVWAKFLNAGQTCIAPDYVFVHESIYRECLVLLRQEIEKNQYKVGNKNYVQIINERNLARLEQLLDKDKIAFGGQIDREKRTISPTLLKDVSFDDAIMQEEIFGPILPLISYTQFDTVLGYIQDHEKPLSAYLFSNDKDEQAAWLGQLSFGGGCINDAIMHITNPNVPFGGVGQSGNGSYHGKAGFDTFSHRKSVFEKPRLFEVPLKYPPYTAVKMNWIKRLLKFS